MGDEFIQIQEKIEAILTLLKSSSDADSRRTYLLEFRVLLDEADKLVHASGTRAFPQTKRMPNKQS